MPAGRVAIGGAGGAALALLLLAGGAIATPSSTHWTPMVMDIQGFGVSHIGVDNYFTLDRKAASGDQGAFPSDVGWTIGVLPGSRVQLEIGVDALEPSDNPYFFNAKLGAPEGALFSGAPALQVGVFNVGTRRNATDQNIVYGVIGRTIPGIGRVTAGPYAGNGRVLRNAKGEKENTGFMVAFDHGFGPVKDAAGNTYSGWVFAADYASGRNALGGGGAGIYRYFSRSTSLLTGPVWFNEKGVNGAWKWTVQLDLNM
jgi:hypothetical protein